MWSWIVSKLIEPFLPYILGGLVAAGLLGSAFAYIKGYGDAAQNCRESELRAEIATMKRDMAAWKAADEIQNMLQKEMEAAAAELQDKVTQYEVELATRTDTRCILDDRDVRSLDGLRGNGKR